MVLGLSLRMNATLPRDLTHELDAIHESIIVDQLAPNALCRTIDMLGAVLSQCATTLAAPHYI
jgi:hypothetical protein